MRKKTVFIIMYILLVIGLILISHNLAYKAYSQKEKNSNIAAAEEIERCSETAATETKVTTESFTEATTIQVFSETTTEKKYTRGTIKMSHYDTPYEEFAFADDYVFQKLKKAYSEIDFSAKIEKGDLSLYDFYKSKFYKLVNNEVPFFDQYGTGYQSRNTNLYFSDISINFDNPYSATPVIFFLDIDGDTAPELCISYSELYIFKYLEKEDRFILWYYDGCRSNIWGIKKIANTHYGIASEFDYYLLNDDGKHVKELSFFALPIRENVTIYMATFPVIPIYNDETGYYNVEQNKSLDIELQKQGYDQEVCGLIYFRITEEQFNDLTEDFFQGYEDSTKALYEVRYTYDELFGEFEDFE